MQNKHPYKILEKVPLKNKLLMKAILSESAELMVVRLSPEDTLAAAGYSDGKVRVFNLSTDNKIAEINAGVHQQGPINALRWRPQNEENGSLGAVILVANTNGNLYQFAAKTGKQLWHIKQEGNFIMAVDYCTLGTQFATAGKENLIRIYDEQSKKVAAELSGIKWHAAGHNNRIFSIKFKTDQPHLLASGGWDQNVHIWDIRTGNAVSTIYGPKIAGDSIDIEGNELLTGANRGKQQLQLWDWRSNKVVHTFPWDETKEETNNFIFCAQFCKNSKNTVMAVGGNEMKFFSLEDHSEMLQMTCDPQSILYSCDSAHTGNKYVCGGKQGALFYLASSKTFQ